MLFKPQTDELSVTPDGNVTPFANCPACGYLIKLETPKVTALTYGKNCPSCNIFIDRYEIEKSGETYARIVKAIAAASKLVTGNGFLIIVFGQVLLQMLLSYDTRYTYFAKFLLLSSLVYLLSGYWNIQKWLDEFGHLVTKDEEFIAAKKEMRRSRLIWVAATILNLILWFVYFKFL